MHLNLPLFHTHTLSKHPTHHLHIQYFFLFKKFKTVYYLLVVLPPICMIHSASRDISRLLKGRTLTATFTEDILAKAYSTK